MKVEANSDDIAIVGMGCVFPGADSIAQFWENIVRSVDCISDPPPSWRPDHYVDDGAAASEPVYTGKGGYLAHLCRFTPAKYGLMPSSVEGAEPDQFLALRCAAEALADANIPELPLNRAKTGIILGRGFYINRGLMTWLSHGFVIDEVLSVLRQLEPDRGAEQLAKLRTELKRNLPPFNAETVPGVTHCLLSGRIANRLDLHGPSYTLDAACSSISRLSSRNRAARFWVRVAACCCSSAAPTLNAKAIAFTPCSRPWGWRVTDAAPGCWRPAPKVNNWRFAALTASRLADFLNRFDRSPWDRHSAGG